MPQRDSLLPYRGVLSFLSKAREASGSEAARVHHAARRRGSTWPLAARAQQRRADAAHRRAHAPGRGRSGRTGPHCGVSAGAAAIGLDRRPQRADRLPLGRGRCRRIRKYAAELVALAPDVILATGGAAVAPLQQATRTVPIVFAQVPDPVGAGFVDSLARPGGNATGFTIFEYGISGKWLELLKEIAPRVTRAAVLRDPAIAVRHRSVRRHPIRGAVVRRGVEPGRRARRVPRSSAPSRLSRASSNGGLIVTASALANGSSRSDHHACGPAQAARGLLRPLLRHRRRPDLLRARYRRSSTGARPAMSTASSRARSRPTCRCRRRPSTSW